MQIGLGANLASINTIMTSGAAERTDNPLDVMIEGNGFFVVDSGNGYGFTRAGSFRLDNTGYLVTPEGLRVMGWQADDNNAIKKGTVDSIKILSPDKAYSLPNATTQSNLNGNINMNDPDFENGGLTRNMIFYDSLGYEYIAEINITQNATDKEKYTVTVGDVIDSNGTTVITGDGSNTAAIEFDPSTGKITGASSFTISFGAVGTTDIIGEVGDENNQITVDFSELTMINDDTTIKADRGDVENAVGAGRRPGILSSFSIGLDGKIQGSYSNGDNRYLGQIVVAEFTNPAGLEKTGNNLYAATLNSGEFDGIGLDPTVSGGSLKSSVLEMSNVDLSREFTNMITTQRGFQANSRIITTSDEMLQELVNLKR